MLFPYLNGDDLNSRSNSSPSRCVIDFYDRSEAAAEEYKLPYARLLDRVRAERQKVNRKALRARSLIGNSARCRHHRRSAA